MPDIGIGSITDLADRILDPIIGIITLLVFVILLPVLTSVLGTVKSTAANVTALQGAFNTEQPGTNATDAEKQAYAKKQQFLQNVANIQSTFPHLVVANVDFDTNTIYCYPPDISGYIWWAANHADVEALASSFGIKVIWLSQGGIL